MSFDYVIVGAGSAGCVLANRLTADGRTKVALIEAGGPDSRTEMKIPAAFSKLFRSKADWAFVTTPQSKMNGRTLLWPRGKAIGGSSSMNAMIYTRGNPRDYDGWRDAGNAGWGFRDVLPFFEKLEGREDARSRGPLDIRAQRSPNELSSAFLDACAEEGIDRNDDFDGAHQEGAGLFRVNQRRGVRYSCSAAYLRPALERANLSVLTYARTTRVVFEGTRAAGVEIVRDGRTEVIRATREVLLCGGTVSSPQLLMLSGIGPGDHLRSHGIAVVSDLPGVGTNLQDHLATGVAHHCRQPVTLASAESIGSLLRFLLFRRGMLTSNVAEAGAFVRLEAGADRPDIELLFGPTFFIDHGFGNPKGHGFTIGALLLHPKSRGTITLASADPMAPPLLEPNYLDDPDDLRLLAEGVRLGRRVARATAFDRYRGKEELPGEEVQSDTELADFIRRTAETIYHPVGTCRMGSDAMAVVDQHLRVRGVDALRVIDASIMPAITSAHTNAPTVMIAERGSELLLTSG